MSKDISSKPDNQWMVVYTTYNALEAHIVVGRLESEGIRALVHQQAGASAMGIHIGRLGEVVVLVHPPDYERALMILFPEESPELPDDTDRLLYGDLEDDDDE